MISSAIQNNYSEFWTILNWTSPGKVGTKQQWDRYVSKPLSVGQSKSASADQRSKAIVGCATPENVCPILMVSRSLSRKGCGRGCYRTSSSEGTG